MDKANVAVVALVAIGYADISRAHQPGEAFEATEKDAADMVKAGHVILKADDDALKAQEAEAVLAEQEAKAEEPVAGEGEQAAEPASDAPAEAAEPAEPAGKTAAKKR